MVRKRNVFADYDFDYEESWINDMAGKGLLLTGHKRGWCLFEESDNTNRRYAVIPRDKDEFGQEEMQLYLDEGWRPAFGWGGRTYFYTDDPDAPPLFTDEASYAEYLKKNRKAYKRGVIGSAAVVVLWSLILLQNLPGVQSSLSGIGEKDFVTEIGYLLIAVFIIANSIIQGVSYHNSVMRMTGGKRLEWRPEVYRKRDLENKTVAAIAVVAIIAAVLYLNGGTGKVKNEGIYAYNEASPVMLRDISPDEWEFIEGHRKSFSLNDDQGVKYSYSLYHTSNITLKEGYKEEAYFSESMNYSDWELPEYTSLTYEFRSEKTAEKMLMKHLGYDTECGKGIEKIEREASEIALDVPEIDYAGYYEDRSHIGNGIQYLYLRKGSRVVYVSYHGKRDILEELPMFQEQLK